MLEKCIVHSPSPPSPLPHCKYFHTAEPKFVFIVKFVPKTEEEQEYIFKLILLL